MPITRGSAMEFDTKKQRNNYFRFVNTIINDGPTVLLEWAKVPITFIEEDFRMMQWSSKYPLQGFRAKPIKPVGKVSLPESFGDLDNARTETLTFDVVDIYHPYIAIFGRGFMNKFDAVIRHQFLCMKIPAPKGVITAFDDQQEARI
jgi:hypothetical protein